MERKKSVRRFKRKKRFGEKCKDFFRNFVAFLFSNVGIIGLVVGYTIAGSFIFIAIESNVIREKTQEMMDARNFTAHKLWQLTYNINIFSEDVWRNCVLTEISVYQQTVVDLIRDGYDGSDEHDYKKTWTFAGAFLYSLTVITTIGYGNVCPRTLWGKLTTIVYAIIGMPLFLLYLSNIGDILARSFKWIYAKCCLCRGCPGVAKRRAERSRSRAAESYPGSLDSWQGDETGTARSNNNLGGRNMSEEEIAGSDDEDDDDNSNEDGASASEDPQTVTVPLTICLAIMVGYICGGAALFMSYEDWDFLDGSYFCFISLSTIGFGDIVPGDKIYSGGGFDLSFILCSMYLMLGMALIAMCFNLMQEEVIHKIRTTMRSIKYVFRCNNR